VSYHLRTRQSEYEKLIARLTEELKSNKAMLETALTQADRINRQLQLSVERADTMSRQVVETNKSKGDFLAGMSHHIRIPMNAIVGFSEMLSDENLDQDQKAQLKIIRDSSKSMLQLIKDILDFTKIESGRFEIDNNADVNTSDILAAIESVMRPAANEKNLTFDIAYDRGVNPGNICIHADTLRFKQCLMNLVGNAIKFTRKGFVRVCISNQTENGKSFVRFDVEDSGIGIAAENLNRIFEPFSQIENPDGTSNNQLSNTGLGLAVTHSIAEVLGGKLTVQSILSKGSTFSLLVPAAAAKKITKETVIKAAQKKDSVSADKQPESQTTYAISDKFTGKILVAEDSTTNQTLIELLLRKLGLQPTIVENGLLAVQKVNAEKFDVVLMDIQMPVMNGLEATQQIKKMHPNDAPAVIALTACAMNGDDKKCFDAGCDEYLTKPIDRKKLVETLAKYLPAAPSDTPSAKTDDNRQNRKIENKTLDKLENTMTTNETAVQTGETEIDWQLLMERIGDEALIDEIMPIFLKDNNERMQLLAEAVKKNDSKEVKFYAHSIKGACGTIGASKLFELGKELETAGRDEQTEKFAPLFEQIKTRFDNLLTFLDRKDWKQILKDASAESRT